MPAVVDYAHQAGELTYQLRRYDDELQARIAEMKAGYLELQNVLNSLAGEGVRFDPELPPFLLEAFARYDAYQEERAMAKATPMMPPSY